MAKAAQCPSCGASVTFRSGVSILAVCEYCRATLLNVDGKIENLGKMAELAQDRSRLQIGAQGVYRQKIFTVVGRIQLQYEQGLWNEWFLLFDDQRTGWLSEAAGTFSISFQRALTGSAPAFSELSSGYRLRLGNAEWTVTNIERATCVAGEGELPFRVGGGYPAPVADLRSNAGNAFVTLDYSEDEKTPLLFIGETIDFSGLKWRNLREDDPIPTGPKLRAKALLCKKCGATFELRHEGIVSIACAHCGSISDAETGRLIDEINLAGSRKVIPLLPIGCTGVLRGDKLEVIGFMQRYMVSEGQRYYWREYLLARVGSPGYRFLVEYDGHWSVADALEAIPKTPDTETSHLNYQGQSFRHFQSYKGVVDYVIGEFTWLVKTKDTVKLVDYVAPPFMLTLERTDNEISWSLAEYVPFQEIFSAFKLKSLPTPVGVYANQPNLLKKKLQTIWKCFILFISLAFAVQFTLSSNKIIAQNTATIFVGSDAVLLPPFNLNKKTNLALKSTAKELDNGWFEVGLAFIRESDGEVRYGSTEISYYSGWDSEDGYWSEGSRSRTLSFQNVPPGTWRLMLEGIESSEKSVPKVLSLEITGYRALWGNFWILFFGLFIWPVILLFKFTSFEVARWKESDHPGLLFESENKLFSIRFNGGDD